VAALRRYLRGGAKSDRIDGLTLAKMPFIDAEHLDEVYLPPAELHALQRLTRQLERLVGKLTLKNESLEKGLQNSLAQAERNGRSSHAGDGSWTASEGGAG
jgi:transposase